MVQPLQLPQCSVGYQCNINGIWATNLLSAGPKNRYNVRENTITTRNNFAKKSCVQVLQQHYRLQL